MGLGGLHQKSTTQGSGSSAVVWQARQPIAESGERVVWRAGKQLTVVMVGREAALEGLVVKVAGCAAQVAAVW